MNNLFYTIRKLLISYNTSPPGLHPCGLQLFSLDQYDPFRFPSYAGLAYVLNRIQLQREKVNTYTANGMKKKTIFFYVYGSVHHKSILIVNQLYATVCSQFYFTARSLHVSGVVHTHHQEYTKL